MLGSVYCSVISSLALAWRQWVELVILAWSRPAFWNGDALGWSVEISEADVQSLFDEQSGVVLCLVQHAGLLPQYWMLLSPGVLCYGRLFRLSPSGGSSVLFYAGLRVYI